MTGIATRRVAKALPPTPIPLIKVSEKTLYTIASLQGKGGSRGGAGRRGKDKGDVGEYRIGRGEMRSWGKIWGGWGDKNGKRDE